MYLLSLVSRLLVVCRNRPARSSSVVMSVLMRCSFFTEDSPCDNIGIGNEVTPLLACSQDIKRLLETIGASGRSGPITESDLILNRAGYFTVTSEQKKTMIVCPKHRKLLTTDWAGRKVNKCAHPYHKGQLKSEKKPRRVNAAMSVEIYEIYHVVVPIGSGKANDYESLIIGDKG